MTTEVPLTNDVSRRKSSLAGWGLVSALILLSIPAYPLLDGVVLRPPTQSAPQGARYLTVRKSLESLRSGDLVLVKTANGEERVRAVINTGSVSFCARDNIRADQHCVSMNSADILAIQRVCGESGALSVRDCAERFFKQ